MMMLVRFIFICEIIKKRSSALQNTHTQIEKFIMRGENLEPPTGAECNTEEDECICASLSLSDGVFAGMSD